MHEPMAVLSYARTDDRFFGGYISNLRMSLELGVHVVTGDTSFRIFQDVDGIVIGDKWQRRIAEVINSSTFLIPLLSPLYFNSEPCRREAQLFLEREAMLKRDDLMLPVYFIDSPRLEKVEEREKDPLAKEIAKRQIYDWRSKPPLEDLAGRKAVLELATAISKAIERVEGAKQAPDQENLREFARRSDKRVAVVPYGLASAPAKQVILWVDDHPDNNIWERKAFEAYNIRFVLAESTEEAQAHLKVRSFDAIISDMARKGDRRAGFTLLSLVRSAGLTTPVFFYCGAQAPNLVGETARRGGQGVTNNPDELISMVVAALRGEHP